MTEITNPRFTVLSDHGKTQREDTTNQDLFALESRLSPIFDILRHKETVAPLSIAIYGQAGTGRTTALRWLVKQIKEWNKIPLETRDGHPRVIPVWVPATNLHDDHYPEKDIVSSIILKCTDTLPEEDRHEFLKQAAECCVENQSAVFIAHLKQLATQWDMMDIFHSANLGEGEKISSIEQPMKDNRCLNFISKWLKREGSDTRVAVFIDGLDHCPPNVMIRVLDAIGFQFHNSSFIFVAALDATVVHELVVQDHQKQGYRKAQGRHYLSKIFQVECQIEPSGTQIKSFYANQLEILNQKTDYMLDHHLTEDQKKYVGAAILHLADSNPRKIKFFLNSALMTGHAAYQREAHNTDQNLELLFVQSIQIYLLQSWLSCFSIGAAVIYQEEVSQWFTKLSIEACKPNADYQQVKDQTLGQNEESEFYRRRLRSSPFDEKNSDADAFEPPEGLSYNMILEWVWDLLKIPFNSDVYSLNTSTFAKVMRPIPTQHQNPLANTSMAIKKALTTSLNKSIHNLSLSDLRSVVSLDLSDQKLSDIDLCFLKKLENLERLDLHNSNIKQLDWIVKLSRLKVLNLTRAPIQDITPLTKLTTLKSLDLSYTAVVDLMPIACLSNIEILILYGTPTKSIAALNGLRHLTRLNLSFTRITDSDLDVLKTLPLLQNLYLQGTAVTTEFANHLNQDEDRNLQIIL